MIMCLSCIILSSFCKPLIEFKSNMTGIIQRKKEKKATCAWKIASNQKPLQGCVRRVSSFVIWFRETLMCLRANIFFLSHITLYTSNYKSTTCYIKPVICYTFMYDYSKNMMWRHVNWSNVLCDFFVFGDSFL